MALQPYSDRARSAQRNWDNQEDPRIAAEAGIDSTALEALRAMPAVLEEALGFRYPSFWAKAARLLDGHKDAEFAALIREARDSFVAGQIEDAVDDEGISASGAIDHLLRRYAA